MTESEKRKGRVTAGELLADLEKDPTYQKRMDDYQRQREENIRLYREAAAPVLDELAQVGFLVQSVGDLYHMRLDYRSAVPVLLKWLPRMKDMRVREDLVRALSVRWARPIAGRPLVEQFTAGDADTEFGHKWAVANALSVVADDSVFDEIADLVLDVKHGNAREMLAVALGNMKNPKALGVLIRLLGDEEVAGHAVMGLRKLGNPAARPYLQRFLDHSKSWVRNEATRAIAKIDKRI